MEKQFNDYFGDRLEELAEKISYKTGKLERILEREDALEKTEIIFEVIDEDFKSACFDIFEAAEASGEWKENEEMFSRIHEALQEVKDNIIRMKFEILNLLVPNLNMAS